MQVGVIFRRSWGYLGRTWGHLGLIFDALGVSLGSSWAFRGAPWALLGPSLAIFGHLGGMLSSSEALDLKRDMFSSFDARTLERASRSHA